MEEVKPFPSAGGSMSIAKSSKRLPGPDTPVSRLFVLPIDRRVVALAIRRHDKISHRELTYWSHDCIIMSRQRRVRHNQHRQQQQPSFLGTPNTVATGVVVVVGVMVVVSRCT